MKRRKLGSVQRAVLESLVLHGSWHPRCGWYWDTLSNTQRLMSSLVSAGYAVMDKGVYRPHRT